VLNDSLRGKTWLIDDRLTIADFSVGALVASAERMGLPVGDCPEILRWYKGLVALPAWREALAAKDAAMPA
jgi:glutathione S-transferase